MIKHVRQFDHRQFPNGKARASDLKLVLGNFPDRIELKQDKGGIWSYLFTMRS